MTLLYDVISRIGPLDSGAMDRARARQDTLTKPQGSLGVLEEIGVQLAGIFGEVTPRIDRKVVILAAGDHGVAAEGVSAYPQEVTAQMVLNFLGGGAAISVLSRHVGAEVVIVDAGVAGDLPESPNLLPIKLGKGTKNIARGPAMSDSQAVDIVEAGIRTATEQVTAGADLIATGEMGIGNTTPASAITAVVAGVTPETSTGRGTGVSDNVLLKKIAVIERAVEVNRPDPTNSLDVLAKVGGFEIGFLAGVILGAASSRRPVVIDGFISGAAALIASAISKDTVPYMIASHRSVEPGHNAVLSHLGLRPMMELEMRLGEGTGAALAMHIVEAAAKCQAEMATFGDAGVSDRTGPDD